MTTIVDSEKVIDLYIQRLSKNWEVLLRTDKGVQVKKVRKLNMLGFWAGLVLLPFWGIGVIFWVLALMDYFWQFLQGEKIKFVSTDEMIRQLKGGK